MKKKWTTEVPFEVEPVVVEMEGMEVCDEIGGLTWTCRLCRTLVSFDGGGDPKCDCGTWRVSVRAELHRGQR